MQIRAIVITATLLIASAPIQAQEARITRADAADRAGALAAAANTTWIPGAVRGASTPEARMQAHLDEVVAVASSLEAALRSGSGKASSRRLYRQLQPLQLKMLELAVYQKVEIDPAAARLFDQLMAELASYYRGG